MLEGETVLVSSPAAAHRGHLSLPVCGCSPPPARDRRRCVSRSTAAMGSA
jgi:hypothetical protein